MLEPFAYFYNTTVHKTTNQMPYYLHHLRYPHKGLERFAKSGNQGRVDLDLPAKALKSYAEKCYQEATQSIIKASEGKGVGEDDIKFKCGDLVLTLNKTKTGKFENNYLGPFYLKKLIRRNAYLAKYDMERKT
ncbi:Hypothetical protein SRAE_0000051900 [Strongyloides ratti]|uniref:Ribonuclease H-like domain-containing protein n=1 Tax=Strongyloides ratti TaxID=34506 RepID=A0A090KV46_STRRB|nr:Hypothetical protein SRAE_0000051900 [Strongyloides ratti]CEF61395.1 Hypothetical protein SRAE_0000051900 [Strongyloides ratti]